jgi:signal transduction histidine kinase
MKLINYINIRFMLLLLVIFTLAGIGMYIKLGFDVDENIDEILTARMDKIIDNLARHPQTSFVGFSADQSIQISEVKPCESSRIFSDTVVLNLHDKRYDQCRKITALKPLNGHFYKIQITYSRFETEDMVEILFTFMIGLFVMIVALLYYLNYRLSKSVWQPFFKTINTLRSFKIGQREKVVLNNGNIQEFNQLNSVLTEMMDKIQSDFNNLKEFTENAAHEIQTPLAIIKSKLETILQEENISPDVQQQVQIAYKTVARLSKLNEGLLLLSKIENRQFVEQTDVDLCQLIRTRLEFIEDLFSLKSINLKVQLAEPVIFNMNPVLADVLISNLLNNALKHNLQNGTLSIVSSHGELIFSNSGLPLTVEPEKLFQRFSKNSASNESTGLGLAIVSEICHLYAISLQYFYADGQHSIKLGF